MKTFFKVIFTMILVGVIGLAVLAGFGANMQIKAEALVRDTTGSTVFISNIDENVLCTGDKVGISVLTIDGSYPVCVGLFSEAVPGTEND